MRGWLVGLLLAVVAVSVGLYAVLGGTRGQSAPEDPSRSPTPASLGLPPEGRGGASPAAQSVKAVTGTVQVMDDGRGGAPTDPPVAGRVVDRAWRLANESRLAEARELVRVELEAGGDKDPDLLGTALAIDLIADGSAIEPALRYLEAAPAGAVALRVRGLASHRLLEAGKVLDAARAIGRDCEFSRADWGLAMADRLVEAASAADHETGALAISQVLQAYTRGPLVFADHESRLGKYYKALQGHLNRLLFDPAGTWHSREVVVRPGEWLDLICNRFATANAGALRITPGLLALVNRLPSVDRVQPNQVLRVPVDQLVTVVDKGSFMMKVFLGDLLIRLYHVGLGQDDSTPATEFTVIEKQVDPPWYRPDGKLIPPGAPDNVLGKYFVKFGHPRYQGFGIHGTKDPASIGKTESMGCVRMWPKDLEDYFALVPRGSVVLIRDR